MTQRPIVTRLACRVVGLDQATHDIRILRLAPEQGVPFRFRAGQYSSIAFGRHARRDYSMANRPDEPLLEFHIRDMGEGASRYVAERLTIGETVTLDGPFGEACLREGHHGPLLAIAGGSGLAPIKSIVGTALALDPSHSIHLYFGVRTECDLYLVDFFAGLAETHRSLRFIPVLSEPRGATPHRTGLINEALANDLPDSQGFEAYLAGPPVMVEAAIDLLQSRGLPARNIHADPFYGDAEARRRRGKTV